MSSEWALYISISREEEGENKDADNNINRDIAVGLLRGGVNQ
jgi:hypothetical protein